MHEPTTLSKPTRFFWIVSALALVWNLVGVLAYLMSVTLTPESLEAMTEAERALYTDIPSWATAAYAIAVFGGTLGCIFLLLRKAWAIPLFIISLAAILVQMTHALFMTDMIAVRGPTSIILPVLVILVAIYLIPFSLTARIKGWIR